MSLELGKHAETTKFENYNFEVLKNYEKNP
jgi:hypothetical protein